MMLVVVLVLTIVVEVLTMTTLVDIVASGIEAVGEPQHPEDLVDSFRNSHDHNPADVAHRPVEKYQVDS